MARPPCDCGNPDATWRGDTMRVYACDACAQAAGQGFRLSKTNARDLTSDEEQEITVYFTQNPDADIAEIVTLFEKKFQTTITQTRVMRIMFEAALQEGA